MTDVSEIRASASDGLPDHPAYRATAAQPSVDSAPFAPTVHDVLATPALRHARVLAGSGGLGRRVGRLPVLTGETLESARPYDLAVVAAPLRRGDGYDLLTRLANNHVAGLILAVGQGAPTGSRRLLPWADRLGLPLVAVPDGNVADLETRVLAELLDRRGAALAWAERVHRGLEHIVRVAGGLQDVADEIVRLLRAAVFVTATDGRVLASSGAPRLLSPGRSSALFDSLGRCLAAQQRPGVYARSDGGGSHAVVAVVIGLEDQARIVAVREQGGFAPEELQALERAATVVALGLARRRAAAEVDARLQGELLRDLLDGSVPRERAARAGAQFGWDVERPLAVAVSELELPDAARRDPERGRLAQERFATAWSVAVRARDPRAAVAGISEQVVCLVGTAGDPGDLVREAAGAVGTNGTGISGSFTTGVSRVVASVAQLPEAYDQARRAVTVGRQVHGPGSVTDFNGLGVYRLLSLVPDSGELRGFVREMLGELVTRDDSEMRDLRQTLDVLLETNLNVAETARRQHFHYNTLRYRIAKLERMVGPFTGDAHLRLNLMLALQIVRMRGVDGD